LPAFEIELMEIGEVRNFATGSEFYLIRNKGIGRNRLGDQRSRLVDALFGCPHKHCTFPITAKSAQPRAGGQMTAATYIVCLDCGKEFGYDWQKMRVIAPANHAA
jgi:hypothetical protein